MKMGGFILSTCMLITVTSSYADVCQYGPGSVTCGKGSVNNLNVNGVATLNGTTVTNTATINGTLTANNALINMAHVNGKTTLTETTISNDASLDGLLNATQSKFQGLLTLNSNFTVLNQSNASEINISTSVTQNSAVCLENGTHTGDIIFMQNNGIVYLSGGSTVGKVTGGQVIQGDCPNN